MIELKKLIPLIVLLVVPHVSFAEDLYNCSVDKGEYDLVGDHSKICVMKLNKKYYIKEIISKCGGSGFKDCSSSFLNKKEENGNKDGYARASFAIENYNQREVYTRVHETKNIPDDFFNIKFEAENYNGVIIFKGEDEVYSARVGYIQENGHYLSIDNNKVNFEKENVEPPEKAIIKHKYVFLNNKKKLFYKEKEGWMGVELPNVYDFIYLDSGDLYALTQQGIFMATNNELSDFKLIPFDKDGVEKEFKREEVEKSSIYLGNSAVYILFDDKTKYYIGKNLKNKTVNKVAQMGFDRVAYHYRESADSGKVKGYVSDINAANLKYSIDYETLLLAEFKKEISTRYNNNIKFENPEKEILYMTDRNPVYKHEEGSLIVNLLKYKNKSFLLRDNGRLEIYNHKTKKLEIIYNINRIEKENDTIYMIVDKDFNSTFERDLPYYGTLSNLFNIKGKGVKISYSDYKLMSETEKTSIFFNYK